MDGHKLLCMEPNMLLSIVNMKLRDEFRDLEDLCSAYGINEKDLKDKLHKIDYVYNEQTKQFI